MAVDVVDDRQRIVGRDGVRWIVIDVVGVGVVMERIGLHGIGGDAKIDAAAGEAAGDGDGGIALQRRGDVISGRRVEVTDAEGTPRPQGGSGSVRIRASSGLLPFYDLAEVEARKSPAFFCPGDLGSIDAQGHLVIHGREDNVINIGGTKTTPESLERTLLAAPGVQDCAITVNRDELGIQRIVAFLVPRAIWDQGAFLEFCEASIVRDLLPNKFVMLKNVPRNQNMKIDRVALAKLA